MKTQCALIGAHDGPVCGAFLLRVGSVTIDELREYLDQIERHCEISPTQLLGMIVWTNEQLNWNMGYPRLIRLPAQLLEGG